MIPVDDKNIITPDESIKEAWEDKGGRALFIRPGRVKLPGYKSGFIGGASGVYKDKVFFAGSLKYHPDGDLIKDFIKESGRNVIELYDGPLHDVGSIYFFEVNT